jgi:hypothetical protein
LALTRQQGEPLPTTLSQLLELFARIPHTGFFAALFVFALLLACALVLVWQSIAASLQNRSRSKHE